MAFDGETYLLKPKIPIPLGRAFSRGEIDQFDFAAGCFESPGEWERFEGNHGMEDLPRLDKVLGDVYGLNAESDDGNVVPLGGSGGSAASSNGTAKPPKLTGKRRTG